MSGKTSPNPIASHKFTLSFGNGKSVTATIHEADSRTDCLVLWAGAVERLPFRPEVADSLLLRVLFRSFARELKARFKEAVLSNPEENKTDPDATHWLWRENLASLASQAEWAC